MMLRSMSGLERSVSCNYMVIPPGMPVMASTPARNCCDNPDSIPAENTIFSTGLLGSLLVFLMWVGAWGAIDTIIGLVTDFPSYQLAIYLGILVVGSIGVWLQIADWKRAQEELDALAMPVMKDGVRRATKSKDTKPSSVDWGKRLLTAALAIPSLLVLLSLHSRIWTIFVLAMIGVGYKEFSNLINYEIKLVYALIPLIYYFGLSSVSVFGVTLFLLFVPLVDMGPSIGMRNGVLHVFFLNMFALPTMYGARMHSDLSNGPIVTLLWILMSFSSDAGALIVGSRLGKHLLCPSISPKKTWEGVVGSFVGGLGSGAFFFLIGLGTDMSCFDFLVLGFIAAFMGVVGDLIESGFKRFVNAKDASGLLPGHGGMLDRMDALAAAAPFVYAYCTNHIKIYSLFFASIASF